MRGHPLTGGVGPLRYNCEEEEEAKQWPEEEEETRSWVLWKAPEISIPGAAVGWGGRC